MRTISKLLETGSHKGITMAKKQFVSTPITAKQARGLRVTERQHYYQGPHNAEIIEKHEVGDTIVVWYGAPGGGKRVEEVVHKDRGGLITKVISDTWQDPEDYDEY